ncbi:MFS transporter [Streptomyces flavidovirens]|uniref:MFS transporter n=1 Tax=Streptomyces flavidovirens TaxID=67298 RepID=UPI0004250840|nr:MFS transporter [Streptomyces flavidovirens]
MKQSPAQDWGPEPSAWAPMRRPVFRALWIAQLAANMGTWMQTVGAQWLMGDLGGGAFEVALVQTATTLPVFALVVPAGALGDILDQRRLLLGGQLLMFLGAAGLAGVTAAGAATQGLLLGLTALMGVGEAFCISSFQAIQPELVSREEIPQAALLNSANGNVARAAGPALGGAMIAATGPEATFALNALSFLGVLVVLYAWKRPVTHRPLGSEHIRDAIRAGARYVRSAPLFGAVIGRSGLFMIFAGGLWALLPTVARGPLGLSAGGYGLLLASVGLGAVLGAVLLPSVRPHLKTNVLVTGAMVVYAATMAVIGLVPSALAVAAALIVSGLAWVAVLSTLSASAQVLLPAWARTRGLAYYQLVFMGGQALGGVGWGMAADRLGVGTAFVVSGIGLLVTTVVGTRLLPMPSGPIDVRPAQIWADVPDVAVPGRDAGPVLVTVEWRVDRGNAEAFIEAMRPVGMSRRRTGASLWGLFEDMADPTLFLETFTVGSEREHLRLIMERGTKVDQELEARALALTRPGSKPFVRHMIWAYASGRDEELSSLP